MPNREGASKVAAEWVGKAENDLKNAVHTLKMGSDCPTDTICFHAQQCIEKYLKALLVLEGLDFPKTHNISNLLELLPTRVRPLITEHEQDTLTEYATVTRYPGEYEPISLTEARKAVALARRVRGYIRKLFPKEMLN
jgi:HEPN domain-containing protein